MLRCSAKHKTKHTCIYMVQQLPSLAPQQQKMYSSSTSHLLHRLSTSSRTCFPASHPPVQSPPLAPANNTRNQTKTPLLIEPITSFFLPTITRKLDPLVASAAANRGRIDTHLIFVASHQTSATPPLRETASFSHTLHYFHRLHSCVYLTPLVYSDPNRNPPSVTTPHTIF